MTEQVKIELNGVLPLPSIPSKHISGGPFPSKCQGEYFFVCVKEELDFFDGVDVYLPIENMNVPQDALKLDHALSETIKAVLADKKVFVGCMAGWGRTGVFLGLLAKIFGADKPIDYVRTQYAEQAIESVIQEQFINQFDPKPYRNAFNIGVGLVVED